MSELYFPSRAPKVLPVFAVCGGLLLAGMLSGLIVRGAYSPDYRMRFTLKLEREAEAMREASVAPHRKAGLEALRRIAADPELRIPDLSEMHEGAFKPESTVEVLRHPGGLGYSLLVEVPEFLDAAGKEAYRREISRRFVEVEALVDRLRDAGTPVPPWLGNDYDAYVAFVAAASAVVGERLADPAYVRANAENPGADVAAILYDRFGDEEGVLQLPVIRCAATPQESGRLTGFSPLRLVPLYRIGAAEGDQRRELLGFEIWFWDLVTLLRTAEGTPADAAEGVRYKPSTDAELVLHTWLWYFFIDGNPQARVNVAMNVNPLIHLIAQLAFCYESGRRLDSVQAPFPADFVRGAQSESSFFGMPAAAQWSARLLYEEPLDSLEFAGLELLNIAAE